jgi:hypothetical protein
MIVSRPFQNAVRGFGRGALDLPVAALAAVAALFVAFVIPGELLGDAIGATGLPGVLPAAAAPLGLTARIAVGAAGALVTFGAVLFLLRLLDRKMLGGPKKQPAGADYEAPKARRRDSHPDAPVPRPISAAREFGEPTPPVFPSEKAPIWLAEAEPEIVNVEPEPEPEPEVVPQPAPSASLGDLMGRLEAGLARRRPRQAAPMPQVFPEAGDDRLQSAIDSLQRLAARQT